MKKLWMSLTAITLISMLTISAFAAGINARIKSVDATANTFTVIEGGKDYTFTVNGDTKFVNAKGDAVPTGINSVDLKAGTRLSITYEAQGDTRLASVVKLRDLDATPATGAPSVPPTGNK